MKTCWIKSPKKVIRPLSIFVKSDSGIIVDISNTMATKVVYFVVGGRSEQAEFRSDDSTDDIRGMQWYTMYAVCVYCNGNSCGFAV